MAEGGLALSQSRNGLITRKGVVRMKPITSPGIAAKFKRRARDPVKLTSLFYLREALICQRFEDCADLIGIATEFGAGVYEIRALLEDARRQPGS